MAYCGDGSKFGVNIEYSLEDKPLHTVGPVKLIDNLPDNFLVMNGDLLTDLDFEKFFSYHLENKALLTVASYHRKEKIDLGVIDIDETNMTATGFREKPEYDFHVSMGVYAFNKRVLDHVPQNERFGFDDLMWKLLEAKEKIQIYPFDGYWLDIGRPDDYEKANQDLDKLNL